MKFGVVTPSTNTVVQPEYDDLRPPGVTNHIARMHIADDPVGSDADFDTLIAAIDQALEDLHASLVLTRVRLLADRRPDLVDAAVMLLEPGTGTAPDGRQGDGIRLPG
jgi:hypothetical protein